MNLITEEVRAKAAVQVRSGRAVSLALPIEPTPMLSGPFAPATVENSPVQQALMYTGSPPIATADLMVVTNHHSRSTHIDALSHQMLDGRVYPGRKLGDSVSMAGVRHGSTSAFANGIVTRGVLLDLAAEGALPSGHPITARDLERTEERHAVAVEPGDALVIRCGWSSEPDPARPMPGMTLDAVRWMHRRDISLYAGDVGDAHPPLDPSAPLPLHGVGLVMLGMPLIDAGRVDELAAVCAELGRYAFLLSVAPPRIRGLTGVPVNPQALF